MNSAQRNATMHGWLVAAARLQAVWLLAAAGAALAQAEAEPPLVDAQGQPSFVYPQRRESNGYSLVVHAPQIRSWADFATFEALVAIELTPPGGSAPSYASAVLTGDTTIDMAKRLVTVRTPKIGDVRFAGDVPSGYRDTVRGLVTRTQLDVPLDLFLTYLADDVLSRPPPPGFNTDPPAIVVKSKPTVLLFIDGEAVFAEVADTGLEIVMNANWPVFRDSAGDGSFYLIERDRWLTSATLEDDDWRAAASLPAGFSQVPDVPEYATIIEALPLKEVDRPVPRVLLAATPTELIVTDGRVRLEDVPGTDGLEHVANTDSMLFRLDRSWYFLVSGRWFMTDELKSGPWSLVTELPQAFEDIPEDHSLAAVRASVPGTPEARMAALEASLPQQVEVEKNAAPATEVTYAGEPEFEPIGETGVARAVNSAHDVIQYDGRYYLCHAGAWYLATSSAGPWTATDSVPPAVYTIPPSSPAYHVTHVTVADATPTSVVYTYPPAYSTNVYVAYGVPYYGTGWYYPPYAWGGYYYPYYASYGHGNWYNPATGGYGSRSAWYGPYGGYSYARGYDPSTGRYGYMETAWDHDDWESYGETYNPRTGISTETTRHYDEDDDRLDSERIVERGDDRMKVERTFNDDSNTSKVQRFTSAGGSSTIERRADDGTVTSGGSITTRDGITYTRSSEQTRSGGTASVTGDTGSLTATTRRDGRRSVTGIEGSGGGYGTSVSGVGPGRTTFGQSGSGDLYAGHDGSVFKKTDAGWQRYDDGEWGQVDVADRPERTSSFSRDDSFASSRGDSSARDRYSSRYSELNRDYSARQRASSRYQQRRSAFGGGGMRSRGGFRRR